MLDFSKTFCDLHPNQLITNFCTKQECNVGLCATCICSHTESHIQKRTAPEYQNIRSTYSKMHEGIRSRITTFEQQKSKINTLIEIIQGKRKEVVDIIFQARHETLDFVNRFYDAKEKQLMRKIEADQKKLGLHNQNRMQSLLNIISRDINTLFTSAQDLNSQNFLESFHRIRTQVLVNSAQTHRQIGEQLQKNQNYKTSVTINPIYINDVKASLEKSISLIFSQKRMQQAFFQTELCNSGNTQVINNPNENSSISVMPRRNSQSLSKSIVFQPQYPQASMQAYPQYFVKQLSQSQLHTMRRSQPFPQNNCLQIPTHHNSINYSSRIEFKGNNTDKNIKQNGNSRSSITNGFTQSTFGQITGQTDPKKIRRSGLSILKAKQNQIKNQ